MTHFTDDQLIKYRSVIEYEKTRRNLDQKGGRLFDLMGGGLSGKSALLKRISEGKRPLAFPPPTSYSYPWYEIIEGNAPIELGPIYTRKFTGQKYPYASSTGLMAAESIQDLIGDGQGELHPELPPAGNVVLINQSKWEVISVDGETSATLSYGEWKSRGFTWRLSLEEVPAAESLSFMCSWHNPEKGRVTTLDEMMAELRWHIDRRKPAPPEDVVALLVGERLQAELLNDYRIAEDGQTLLKRVWRLERMTPAELPEWVFIQIDL